MEIFKIPKDQRVVVGIDLKSGTEIGKSQYCLDAFGIDLERADVIITNIAAEMDRRHRLINSNPQEYWDGKTHPSHDVPLIVCFVDELAMLGKKADSKELEEIRKHAWGNFDRLLYLGRNAGICTISCIQRPDAKIVDSFTRAQYQCRLCGYVSNRTDNDMVFGTGAAEQGIDASKLSGHWFWGFIEGKGYYRFKVPGEFDDSDLKDVFLNPRYYAPKGRGDWLTAEPDTPAAIAPWWPDSPYHDAFLRDFRDEDEDETDNSGYGYGATRGSYAPAHPTRRPQQPSRQADDYEDLDECEPFWEDEQPAPSSPRRPPRRAPRQAPRQANRPPRQPRRPVAEPDIEDIEEISMEDLMGMVKESQRATAPVNDLNASFEEIDDDQSYEAWGESVFVDRVEDDEDSDELVKDYDEAWWGAMADNDDAEIMALPPHVASRPSPKATPKATAKPNKTAKATRRKSPVPSTKRDTATDAKENREIVIETRRKSLEANQPAATNANNGTEQEAPRRRSRKRANSTGEKPRMRNGMPLM